MQIRLTVGKEDFLLLIILFVANIIDAVSTVYAMMILGARELNLAFKATTGFLTAKTFNSLISYFTWLIAIYINAVAEKSPPNVRSKWLRLTLPPTMWRRKISEDAVQRALRRTKIAIERL